MVSSHVSTHLLWRLTQLQGALGFPCRESQKRKQNRCGLKGFPWLQAQKYWGPYKLNSIRWIRFRNPMKTTQHRTGFDFTSRRWKHCKTTSIDHISIMYSETIPFNFELTSYSPEHQTTVKKPQTPLHSLSRFQLVLENLKKMLIQTRLEVNIIEHLIQMGIYNRLGFELMHARIWCKYKLELLFYRNEYLTRM